MMRVIDIRELIEMNIILEHAVETATKLRDQWQTIKWKSAEKDNMEFRATVTCFQKEEIDRLFKDLIG